MFRNLTNAKAEKPKQEATDQQFKVYKKRTEKTPLGERMRTAKLDNKLAETCRQLAQQTTVQ